MSYMILFLAMVVASLLLFDIVLRKQYRDHREQWRQDGCPWGFFQFPREVGFLDGCMARGSVFRNWTFANPAWSQAD